MKSLLPFFLFVLLTGLTFADVPRNPRPERYRDLYLRSAITDPPPVVLPDAKPSDLPDWVLVGLSKYVDGVKVKVMNKKDRTRVTIPSREATEMGFSIKEVKQDRNFMDEAVVTLRKGNAEGEVRFDPQFLVLKKVAGAPTQGKAPGANGKRGSVPVQGRVPTPSKVNRPPTPGRPGSSSAGRSSSPPRPGSVPRPAAAGGVTSSSTKASTNGATRTPPKRGRYNRTR